MQSLACVSGHRLENLSNDDARINSTSRDLPREIWLHMVKFLDLNTLHCLAFSTSPNILSISAFNLCLKLLNYIELDSRQRWSVLRKLYIQGLYKKRGTVETFKTLLQLMLDPLHGTFKDLLLEEAIVHNDLQLVFLSISCCSSPADLAADLVLAVKHRRTDLIKYFVARKANVDVDIVKETDFSLQIACVRGDAPLIHLLLRNDHYERTILHVATCLGCYDIVENLHKGQVFEDLKGMECNYGLLPIHYAILAADFKIVQLLASLGCSIHTQFKDGNNILHFTVIRHTENMIQREEDCKIILKWLIAKGCDQTARNNSGKLPLDYAKDQDSPQWSIDILQMHVTESNGTGTDKVVPEIKISVLGQNTHHSTLTSDNEYSEHDRQTSQLSPATNSFPTRHLGSVQVSSPVRILGRRKITRIPRVNREIAGIREVRRRSRRLAGLVPLLVEGE